MVNLLGTPEVDLEDPALALECSWCGLTTPRFLHYCRNCGSETWPSAASASAAFAAWKAFDPCRATARPYDLNLFDNPSPSVDYNRIASGLGIHLFPPSVAPILLSLGMMFLALAAVPFPQSLFRIAFGGLGGFIFLLGVVRWLVIEDSAMFPDEQGGE